MSKSAPSSKAKSSTPPKRPKQAAREKPLLERTIEERFGVAPPPRGAPIAKQVRDVLAYLEACQERGESITWAELVEKAMPSWCAP